MARSHVYGFVSTITRVSSTRSRHISCGADLVLLPARDTSRPSSCTPRALALSPRRKTGVGGGCLLSTQARYSDCCATVHRRCQRCSGLGVAWGGFRHCHVSYGHAARVPLLPLRHLAPRWAPITGQALFVGRGVHHRWAYTLGAEAQFTFSAALCGSGLVYACVY